MSHAKLRYALATLSHGYFILDKIFNSVSVPRQNATSPYTTNNCPVATITPLRTHTFTAPCHESSLPNRRHHVPIIGPPPNNGALPKIHRPRDAT